ncbi:MAG: glycosyltransferase family 2 protein, partial [Methanosarcinaceae archaeon]|nr:glycosyltransferase family 2 protein [Methanosarcinaceae archaeon]
MTHPENRPRFYPSDGCRKELIKRRDRDGRRYRSSLPCTCPGYVARGKWRSFLSFIATSRKAGIRVRGLRGKSDMTDETRNPKYILVTPARNEEAFLEETIHSVTGQTLLPERWAIVSDGSTDRTDEIIQDHAARHAWIRYVRRPAHAERHFAAKAHAFSAGYTAVRPTPHDVVGNLDADLSLGPDIMQFLMGRFAEDSGLGVAGVPFAEESGGTYDYRFTNIEHVSGACQLFRRECFEAIGGYKPIEGGGIDWLAVTTARMMGWKTRAFTERSVLHHRKIGTGNSRELGALYRQGAKEYYLGNHPLWQIFRALYQMRYR